MLNYNNQLGIAMDNSKKLVTIGVTCYNARHSIEAAINSALAQTWSCKELIIVDDFSTDGSQEIIQSCINGISFVRLICNKKNFGVSYSRNLIVENSSAEYICFMDDDDISEMNRVELQMADLLQLEHYGYSSTISICGVNRIYPSGSCLQMPPLGQSGLAPSGCELADYLLFFERKPEVDYGFCAPTCAMLISKSCFSRAGLFDTRLRRVEDAELSIRLSIADCKFIGTKELLVTQYSTSSDDKTPDKNYIAEMQILYIHQLYLREKGLFLYAKNWTRLRYYYFKKDFFMLFVSLFASFLIKPIRTFKHFFTSAYRRFIRELHIIGF